MFCELKEYILWENTEFLMAWLVLRT